jgi:hypothetical protein
MLSQLGHWVARIFMNAALLLPRDQEECPVEFVDQENRFGYRFKGGFDFDFHELGERVAETFARYAVGSASNVYEDTEQAQKATEFYLAREAEMGTGIWDWLNQRLRTDVDYLVRLTSRYEQLLITRHLTLFTPLTELEEQAGLLGDAKVDHVSGGIYAVFFRTAMRTAEELRRRGHPCALRAHSIE